jgi:hypothetical protein
VIFLRRSRSASLRNSLEGHNVPVASCDRQDAGTVDGLSGLGLVAIARVRVLRVTPDVAESRQVTARESTPLTTRTSHAKSTSEH